MKSQNFLILVCLLSLVNFSCTTEESNDEETDKSSLLIGTWQRISTIDQDGNVDDDTHSCNLTEFTETQYIVTDFTDVDCKDEFSSGSLPYTRIGDLIYVGEVDQDIKVEITQLTTTVLKLKGEYTDDSGATYYHVVTYQRRP